MEQRQNCFKVAPEGPAAPGDRSDDLDRLVRPAPESLPRPADERDDLISDRLGDYVPAATDILHRQRRCDGFTPARQVVFLDALARCGVVADAARAAGISRDTAYALRNSAKGAAFALAWEAALLKSRPRLADELESRALNGVVDRIYRNGELWGERHRHDNRLAMAVLTRLDRKAEGAGEGAATAGIICQEWEQFLDIVADGGDGAGDFLASRAAKQSEFAAQARTEDASEAGLRSVEDLYRSLEAFERLFAYSMFGGGLDGEADLSGLDPAEMQRWSDNDWCRAERGGLLDSLRESEWPETVRGRVAEATNGICRNRQDIAAAPLSGGPETEVPPTTGFDPDPNLTRARLAYLRRFPERGESHIKLRHTRSEGGSE